MVKIHVFGEIRPIYLCTVERYKTQIMKNVIKNTKKGFLMVALLYTFTGFANNSNSLIKRDARKTSLVLENVKEGNLLSIKDSHGITLYKESIESNGIYKKGFDLTALPNGEYVFELEKELEIKTIPFTVDSNIVNFNKKDEATYFKPFVKQEKDLVFLTKLNLNEELTTINVYAIYEGGSELRHTETINNVKVIEKAFRLEKGNYKIEINSNNKEYTAFINN